MNGADDDGSGTVVLLEIAERFATETAGALDHLHLAPGRGGGAARLAVVRRSSDRPARLDRRRAQHGHGGQGRVTDVKFGGPSSVQTLGARRLSREFGDIIDSVNAVAPRRWRSTTQLGRAGQPAQPLLPERPGELRRARTSRSRTSRSATRIDYHQATDEPQYIDYDHSARLGRWLHEVMSAIANRRDRPLIAGQDTAYPSCR